MFSPPGTYIPGKNITLGVGTIRGVESRGMLCSAMELGLGEDHDGIIDLPADAPVGMRYAEWAGLGDPVIDFAVTPNRPDALGVHGIARDLAAAGLGKLIEKSVPAGARRIPVPDVGVRYRSSGPRIARSAPPSALRLVRGVKNGPSPEWMQRRLKAIGLRPINALVDITNYITFDRNRPLHVFDLAQGPGRSRRPPRPRRRGDRSRSTARPTGSTTAWWSSPTSNGVESIAGIMGGEHSGCDESTTDVLIESALWDPLQHRPDRPPPRHQHGRPLPLRARRRPRLLHPRPRTRDPDGPRPLRRRSVQHRHSRAAIPETDQIIDFPWSEVKRLTGLDIPVYEMKVILQELGFWVSGGGDVVKVAVPSWRPDVEGKADLVEEIVRIAGLERVEAVPFPRDPPPSPRPC